MPTRAPIRVVIVEDSDLVLEVLLDVCREDPAITVLATARSGPAGVEAILRHEPDIATVDLGLPGFDGFEVVSRVMAERPTPLVVLTATLSPAGRPQAFHALALGAVHVMEKPAGTEWKSRDWRAHFCKELEVLSRVSVVRHLRPRRAASSAPPDAASAATPSGAEPEIVAVVGSAGGAQAARELLAETPDIPAPILVALHLGPTLHDPFAQYLASSTRRAVRVAHQGDVLEPGHVYVAPGRRHIELTGKRTVRIFDELPGAWFAPCHDHLLESVASAYGSRAGAVILTGLGSDGAKGLLAVRSAGGRTLGQDKDSCLVFGMPGAADRAGAVQALLPPRAIGRQIGRWFT